MYHMTLTEAEGNRATVTTYGVRTTAFKQEVVTKIVEKNTQSAMAPLVVKEQFAEAIYSH